MAFAVVMELAVVETESGTILARVLNNETVQTGSPPSFGLSELHGEMFARVIEEMSDSLRDKLMDQMRQLTTRSA